MQGVNPNAAWRDTGRQPKVGPFSFYMVYPFVGWLLHMRYWTFGLVVLVGVFFGVLEYYGFTPAVFFRSIRAKLAGPRRMRRVWWA